MVHDEHDEKFHALDKQVRNRLYFVLLLLLLENIFCVGILIED